MRILTRTFLAFAARLNLFGGELRFRGHEADISGGRTAWSIIYGNPRLCAHPARAANRLSAPRVFGCGLPQSWQARFEPCSAQSRLSRLPPFPAWRRRLA